MIAVDVVADSLAVVIEVRFTFELFQTAKKGYTANGSGLDGSESRGGCARSTAGRREFAVELGRSWEEMQIKDNAAGVYEAQE